MWSLKVAEEARFEAECGADPTAKWGYHQPQSGAPFAIAFAGEAISTPRTALFFSFLSVR